MKIKPQRHRDTEGNNLLLSNSQSIFILKNTLCLCVFVVILFFTSVTLKAQSTNQNFPTAVTTNEISGAIKARDLGDARLTSYFYVFNGKQGDVFINVMTKNLDGDIDIFTADNLKPLSKITVYSDNPNSVTGRVIYLREPQKLILRVEGKTPTDEPATFRVKFAGSFEAVAGVAETEENKEPSVNSNEQGDVRVNSVGTIIETKPKPTPTPKVEIAKVEKPKKASKKGSLKPDKTEETVETPEEKKPETVVTETVPDKKAEPVIKSNGKPTKEITPKFEKTLKTKRVKPKKPPTTAKVETETSIDKKPEVKAVEPALLENIRLIVIFKDGTKIERPMSEILKVGVDKGILTVITKDGNIGRYSILDVAKMTIE